MDSIKLRPEINFAIKCSIAGIIIMLLSMAAGEIFINPQLFGGFLSQPTIWPAILIEILTYLAPCLVVALVVLRAVRNLSPATARNSVVMIWIAIGTAMALSFKSINYPGDWDFARLLQPDVTFGWAIPCALILVAYVFFSLNYLKRIQNMKFLPPQ